MNIEEILSKHIDEEGKFNSEAAAKELKEEQGKAYVPKDDFNSKNEELKKVNTALESLKKDSQNLEELQSEVQKYKLKDLKTTIAYKAGIPMDLADRLSGETEDEIKADAEKLSGFVNRKEPLPLKGTEPVEVDKTEQAYGNILENLNLKGE